MTHQRTIAIGDIHGCSSALDAIRPRPEDVIVTPGDYIKRGRTDVESSTDSSTRDAAADSPLSWAMELP
jgi:hypothetical protein